MVKKVLVFTLCTVLAAPALAGGYGGRYHYGGHYGYRHHGGSDDGAALLAGLVIGGLVGYFISEDRRYRRPAYRHGSYRHPYKRHYYSYGHDYGEPAYHRPWRRPVASRQVVRIVPQPQRSATIAPVDRELAGESCRMTREYTTTIEVDGREREAYGTKCLAADGSWILGRPRLVPEFDQPNTD